MDTIRKIGPYKKDNFKVIVPRSKVKWHNKYAYAQQYPEIFRITKLHKAAIEIIKTRWNMFVKHLYASAQLIYAFRVVRESLEQHTAGQNKKHKMLYDHLAWQNEKHNAMLKTPRPVMPKSTRLHLVMFQVECHCAKVKGDMC